MQEPPRAGWYELGYGSCPATQSHQGSEVDVNQPPQQDPNERIEFNTWMRSPGLQRADYRPEASTPDNKPSIKLPFDRAGLIAIILLVIVLVLVIVWVLHTGGFGTPPVPTPSSLSALTARGAGPPPASHCAPRSAWIAPPVPPPGAW